MALEHYLRVQNRVHDPVHSTVQRPDSRVHFCSYLTLIETAVSNCWTGLWTGSVDWIAGTNQTASKGDDACVVHGTASKAEV